MSEWQPIETAPKDGSWILLAGGNPDFYDYLGEIKVWPNVYPAFWEKDEIDEFLSGWACCYWDGRWRTFYIEPTHWTPLPEPPEDPNA